MESFDVAIDDSIVGPLVFDAHAEGPNDGEPVLFLHGFPQTWFSWKAQLDAVGAAGYRAVAFDQRGYSPRARPSSVDAYSQLALAADVVAVADALGFDRFHLVGHDWGGAIAWQVAGRYSDRLLTLTVLSTPHPAAFRKALFDTDETGAERSSDQAQRSGYMDFFRSEGSENGMLANDAAGLRMIMLGSGLTEEQAKPYVEALSTPEALGAALNWYRAADLTDVDGLGPITMPTMYVWSTNDVALGPDAAHATEDCVAGPYRFEVLHGVSHWIAEEAPDQVNALLLDHLPSAHR